MSRQTRRELLMETQKKGITEQERRKLGVVRELLGSEQKSVRRQSSNKNKQRGE